VSEKEKVWLASLFSDGRGEKRKGGSQNEQNERLGGGVVCRVAGLLCTVALLCK
jgi:hypothetical protein